MNDVAASFTMEDLARVLSVAGLVIVVAIAAVRLSTRTGLPSLLLYMLIGVAMGEVGFGIPYESMSLTRILGYVALIVILGEGGLTTSWSSIRPSIAPAALLSTVGVVVSVAVVGVAARVFLDVDWAVAFLIGAILSSTDAAAVFSVLRRVPLPRRLSGMLEAESGFNDAPVVLLVVSLSALASPVIEDTPLWAVAVSIVVELIGGAIVGLLIGWVGAWFMGHMTSTAAGLFPIGVFAWVFVAYGAASLVHCSGFLAAYLAALVLGNSRLPHRASYRGFAQALGWFAQIGLFVMIGLLASPSELAPQLWPAVVLGLVLLLVARPLSVVLSTVWFGTSRRDMAFLSWAGLRGAVPIVLATVPVITGVPDITWLFNLVFVLVVVFTLVQAPTLAWVALRSGVAAPERALDLNVDSTPLEEMGVDLLEVRIGPESRMHGIELFELRLPKGAEVSLIVRKGAAFVPTRSTILRRGDQLLVMSTLAARNQAQAQLAAVNTHGRLAGWSASPHPPRPRSPVVDEQPDPDDSPKWGRVIPPRHPGQQGSRQSQQGDRWPY